MCVLNVKFWCLSFQRKSSIGIVKLLILTSKLLVSVPDVQEDYNADDSQNANNDPDYDTDL